MARLDSRSRTRTLCAAALLTACATAFAPPASAVGTGDGDRDTKSVRKTAKLEPGKTRGASVVKTGWWNVANEPPPETGLVAAPQPPAPNVPDGGLPVAASFGEPQKLTAIEFALDAEPGSEVTSFKMVLRESEETGAALGAELAQVVACPVTELFWADGQNAAWKNRPLHDCEAGEAPGKRSEDGTWRFDLTDLAAGWAAEDFSGSPSVVLVEKVDPPLSFDLSFDGPAADGIGLAVKSRPGTGGDGSGDGDTSDDGGGGDVGTGSGGDGSGGALPGGDTSGGGLGGDLGGGSSGDLGGDLGGGDLGAVDSGDVPVSDAEPTAVGGETTDGTTEAAPGGLVPVAAPAWYSGLPAGAYLLALVALGLAYLMMLALGPDGRPAATTQRHGVSRALERLRQVRVRGTETA